MTHNAFTALLSQARPTTRKGRLVQFPLTRILAALVFLIPAIAVHNLSMIFVIEKLSEPVSMISMYGMFLLDILMLLFCYRLFVRVVEKRPAVELSRTDAGMEFGLGALLAGTMVGATVMLLSLLGFYHIESTGHPSTLLQALIRFTSGAMLQVLLFRLILFRLMEDWLGSWLALIVVALLFGAAHLANGNLNPLTFGALVVTDVLLMGAFMLTRRIWLVWGIHAGWNFFQDGLFGMPNSGISSLPSWITPRVAGPEWLTGGTFGIEASLPGVVLPLAAGIAVLLVVVGRGQVAKPRWVRGDQ